MDFWGILFFCSVCISVITLFFGIAYIFVAKKEKADAQKHSSDNNVVVAKNKSYKVLVAIFILSIIGIGVSCFAISADKPKNNYNGGDSNFNTTFQKDAPTLSIAETLAGWQINIQGNDDYKYVIIELELYDKNENLLKAFTMRADDIKKGELRQLTYTPSLEEVWKVSLIRKRVQEYK